MSSRTARTVSLCSRAVLMHTDRDLCACRFVQKEVANKIITYTFVPLSVVDAKW